MLWLLIKAKFTKNQFAYEVMEITISHREFIDLLPSNPRTYITDTRLYNASYYHIALQADGY